MPTASPRNLDPKFKDANVSDVPDDAVDPTDEPRTDSKDTAPEEEPEGGWIAHTRRWTDNNGVPQTEVTRMPVSEYAKFEKENGL